MIWCPVGVGGRLGVDIGERVGVEAALECIEVGNGVAEGNGKEKCVKKSKTNLQADCLRQVLLRMSKLLSHMGDSIWRAHGECPVQHPQKKRQTAWPACEIILGEGSPHKVVAGVTLGHGRDDNDSDDSADDDEEHADVLGVRNHSVGKDHSRRAKPEDKQVGDVDLPWLVGVGGLVVDGVHADADVGHDLDQGG